MKYSKRDNKREITQQSKEKSPLRMIFASYGFDSPIMCEKFAKVIPQDESLNKKTCLVVPFAGFDFEQTFKIAKNHLVKFGFDSEKIEIAKRCNHILDSPPDYIYVPGGDTFKLLKSIKDCGLLDNIKKYVNEERAVYIGVSAGAYIAAKNIKYVTQLEDNNEIDDNCFGALDLISKSIVCHYDNYSYVTLKRCQENSDTEIVTINNDQLLICEDGEWSYIE